MKLWFIWLLRPLKNGGRNSHLESVLSENNNNKKKHNLKKTSGRQGYWWQGYWGLKQVHFFSDSKFPKSPQCPPSVCCADLNSGKEQPLRWQCFLWASLFSLKFTAFLFVALGLHCCSCFFLAGARGLLSSRGVQASHGGAFSCCRANSRVLDFQ